MSYNQCFKFVFNWLKLLLQFVTPWRQRKKEGEERNSCLTVFCLMKLVSAQHIPNSFVWFPSQTGRRKRSRRQKRCRFSWGFLGCGEALHLWLWLIAFHINHWYRPGALLSTSRCVRQECAQLREGTRLVNFIMDSVTLTETHKSVCMQLCGHKRVSDAVSLMGWGW